MITLTALAKRTLYSALAGLIVGGAVAGTGAALYYRAEIAQLISTQAEQAKKAAIDAARRLLDANTRADALSAQLSATESAAAAATLEKAREIPRVTTGRPCLGPGAVRLLNGAGQPGAGTVPQTPGAPAAADAAVATDTDVAGWIAGAQGQYETCRARLGALIDFEEGSPQ
ncbi:hypothetical protein GCM10007933_21230 [Zoogloea oryzae]|uniref:Lysozyme n=1 Tax=Zoogloea oryzae TaxID=310767 RepID=A0ABQ6FAR4_9RHOO|nr:hypothetical protein [Zoogloea oryzae]GLT22663.1 hypothetical protein GCM10007933_21230 [Zoogloea oryzae]